MLAFAVRQYRLKMERLVGLGQDGAEDAEALDIVMKPWLQLGTPCEFPRPPP